MSVKCYFYLTFQLADFAQRWAEQCTKANDQFRDVSAFRVGQLVAQRERSNEDDWPTDRNFFIKKFYDEIDLTPVGVVNPYV
jgi:hypothetical protein